MTRTKFKLVITAKFSLNKCQSKETPNNFEQRSTNTKIKLRQVNINDASYYEEFILFLNF